VLSAKEEVTESIKKLDGGDLIKGAWEATAMWLKKLKH